ncbi:MAG: glycoside hydrolase family 15 protein [Pseudomonadota bacterium]|nr:glycoside hydrolase family 15 protein [Pseudomonadota bacterium]
MASQIQDYGLVGDGETCALIARDGSADFLCWPRFDSDACFCALLGDERHGRWLIAPEAPPAQVRRRYRGDTLVLETEFETGAGVVRLTDFMPVRGQHSSLVRIVEGVRGQVAMCSDLRLRFDYGFMPPWSRPDGDTLIADVGPDMVVFRAPMPVETSSTDSTASARFTVSAGQRQAFVLSYGNSMEPPPPPLDADAALAATVSYWEGWISRFDKPCHWPAAVKRSLITLRALIHFKTGGLIAAGTLGLPEVPGGAMNWDYRYCWLRDATFTLTALLNAGYTDEATRWRDWILRAIAGRPDKMQVVYRVDGGRRLEEWPAKWLPGYEASKPVLVGNKAAEQHQLDTYGEVLDAMHVAAHGGVGRRAHGIEVETALVHHLESIWDKPSSDIWESRGEPRCYTYSQAMAWVGVSQFLKGARTHAAADGDMIRRLETLRTTIHAEVCERGFDAGLGHFVDYYGGHSLDASLLLLPSVNFLPADDPRMAGTIAAIERDLMDGGLVRRKPAKNDGHDEGAFLVCSCWLADCMKKQGRCDDARAMLERVIGLSNDVGLLSEEYHVPTQRLIGNMPQALTHLGVVNTALSLSGPVMQRGP